jgi:hypothetical protein
MIMKTIRRLALLAMLGLSAAGTAVAQERPGNLRPLDDIRPGDSRVMTASTLSVDLPAWFKGTVVTGEGDTRTFSIPPLPHTLQDGKETLNWSVNLRLHKRAGHATAVRIFFPCKAVPANVNPERLADLLGQSGAIQDSTAYFIISGSGKDRMLTLVTEMPVAGLQRDKLETEIKGLFLAAERTLGLWSTDMSIPLTKIEKKAEKGWLEGR